MAGDVPRRFGARLTSEGSLVRTQLRPLGVNSERRCLTCGNAVGYRLCSPAGYGCSRLTATSCAQYAPKPVGLVVVAIISGPLGRWPDHRWVPAVTSLCVAELSRS